MRHLRPVVLSIHYVKLPGSLPRHYPCKSNGLSRLALASIELLAGGTVFFPLLHDVKDQFKPTGHAQFVIDAEQIVAHRMVSDA